MQVKPVSEQAVQKRKLKFPPLWIVGPILYVIGVLIAFFTANLWNFLLSYPWISFIIAYMIGSWAGSHFGEMHRRCTCSIRNAFLISDDEFEEILESNMNRLSHPRNLLFGLVFVPTIVWAWIQRLWWQGYMSPFFFDVYYLLVVVFVFIAYSGVMFGAVFGCHLNIHRLCERIPINAEYLMGEGQPILRRLWGDLIGKVTVVAFIMSTLINVPILLYSGWLGSFFNLVLALALTVVIFLFPHYMFHRMLEKAKVEMLSRVLKQQENLGHIGLENLGKGVDDKSKTSQLMTLIYLTQFEWNLRTRSTWLVDLKAVAELLLVASIHVMLMEVLKLFVHI